MFSYRLAISLGIIIFAASCAASTSNLSSTAISPDLPRKQVLDAVPQYYTGKGESCGITAMRMVYAYYGVEVPRKKLAEDTQTYGLAASLISMMDYSKSLGFKVEDKEKNTINDLARNIARGRPVIVYQWTNMEYKLRRGLTHVRVVIGYDADNQKIFMRDTYKGGLSEASFQEFNELWELDSMTWGPIKKNYMMVIYK
jgi:ABC-type bacteriocin/lantibiotic exporter with double-glycine peptidase domain